MLRKKYKVVSLGERHSLIHLSDRVALITKALKRPGKDGRRARVVSAYFGFNTQDEAIAFVARLRRQFPSCYCKVRAGQRLGTAIEVKVRAFDELERFAWELAATPAAAAPVTAARARADLFGDDLAIASNVVSFGRLGAPLANRTRPLCVAGKSID